MLFFTIYTVSASLAQGIGKPIIPMISLGISVVVELGLSLLLIPSYGINGAALATTIANFVLMVTVAWRTLKQANTSLEWGNLGKIASASIIMAVVLFFIPTNLAYTASYVGIPFSQILAFLYILIICFIGAVIYMTILTMIGGVKKTDVDVFLKLGPRLGPLAPLFDKIGYFLMKYAT
jgi:stage V sporulation protein B